MFQQKKPTEFISATQVFQCLLIEGENCGTDALRQAQKFVISDDEFNHFVERHSKLSCLVPESNEKVNELSDSLLAFLTMLCTKLLTFIIKPLLFFYNFR